MIIAREKFYSLNVSKYHVIQVFIFTFVKRGLQTFQYTLVIKTTFFEKYDHAKFLRQSGKYSGHICLDIKTIFNFGEIKLKFRRLFTLLSPHYMLTNVL